jgi:UDP-N-acetylmuramate dehydrogenase
MKIRENILISRYITIKLGGRVKFFAVCKSEDDIKESLNFAKKKKLKIVILGGGSNIIFQDKGFKGLVIKCNIKFIEYKKSKDTNYVFVRAGAGVIWDEFVEYCVDNELQGIECLSGIPGTVGASPIQNIGAYGQEVKDSIVCVKAIDVITLKEILFTNEKCKFGYRQSRFKNKDKGRYIITEVEFRLKRNGKPEIKYPGLIDFMTQRSKAGALEREALSLQNVRDAVIEIRKLKGMVIEKKDKDSISCGSFFVNPIIKKRELIKIDIILYNKTVQGYKVSAARLIEKIGFKKGYTRNGVGISGKHVLALVNRGGTTKELLELAAEIQKKVAERFNIQLEIEPEIIN